MNFRKIHPPEHLKPYIRYFAILEDNAKENGNSNFKIVADGCPGLIFQQNAAHFLDENKQQFPTIFLHGIATKHSGKTTTGNYLNIIANFQPYALKAIFNLDAHDLKNRYADLDAVTKNSLHEQLLCEQDNDKRIDILSRFITDQIKKSKFRENLNTARIIEKINGEHKLSDIHSAFNISERSLERLFKSEIGVSPKMFLRIKRFQNSLNDLRQKRFQSLTDLAYKHFYADQSHYIREFKEFAGITPSQYFLHQNEQVENFPEMRT